jgi:hypothetical protein
MMAWIADAIDSVSPNPVTPSSVCKTITQSSYEPSKRLIFGSSTRR